MKLVFFGKGDRGLLCLKALLQSNHELVLGVIQDTPVRPCEAQVEFLRSAGIPVLVVKDIGQEQIKRLLDSRADVFLLCGFGIILPPHVITIPKLMLNLHAGPVPAYRGSSPLNWAIIRGEKTFGVSILKVTDTIDGGKVLAEEKFEIEVDDTIADLHKRVNIIFPRLLLTLLEKLSVNGIDIEGREQNQDEVVYFHRRFPEDGIISWETSTSKNVIELIRALAPPYPCARTYLGLNELLLKKATPTKTKMVGYPGRIYQISQKNGLLVGTTDWCVWINQWEIQSSGLTDSSLPQLEKYARFSTHPTPFLS